MKKISFNYKIFFALFLLLSFKVSSSESSIQNGLDQITFTDQEKETHKKTLTMLLNTTKNCIEGNYEKHIKEYNATGLSTYRGEAFYPKSAKEIQYLPMSEDYLKKYIRTPRGLQRVCSTIASFLELRNLPDYKYEIMIQDFKLYNFFCNSKDEKNIDKELAFDKLSSLAYYLGITYDEFDAESILLKLKKKEIKPISCVGFAFNCLEAGFLAAEQKDIWTKISTYAKKSEMKVTEIQRALQALGWKLYFWHESSLDGEKDGYDTMLDKNMYGVKTVSYLVDNKSSLSKFKNSEHIIITDSPYILGSASMGYHTFSIIKGSKNASHLYEAHMGESFDSIFNIEKSDDRILPLNYIDGLLAVPLGYKVERMNR